MEMQREIQEAGGEVWEMQREIQEAGGEKASMLGNVNNVNFISKVNLKSKF